MITTDHLTVTLGQALGLPRRLAEETACRLREDGMLPDPEAAASIPDGVNLLLGLMAAPMPTDAPDCVRLYRQLPLDGVTRSELTADGRTEWSDIADPDPIMGVFRQGGERFGEFLESLFAVGDSEPSVDLGSISVGGGPGTATGIVQIFPAHEPVGGLVRFTLAPLGGGYHPDDAPRARLDCYATVPSGIWAVFQDLFDGTGSNANALTSQSDRRQGVAGRGEIA